MAKWSVELRGRVTKDVVWVEVEAQTADEAKRIVMEMHSYEAVSVSLVEPKKPRFGDGAPGGFGAPNHVGGIRQCPDCGADHKWFSGFGNLRSRPDARRDFPAGEVIQDGKVLLRREIQEIKPPVRACKTCRYRGSFGACDATGWLQVSERSGQAGLNICGPEGKMWEPHPPSRWSRFKDWIVEWSKGRFP